MQGEFKTSDVWVHSDQILKLLELFFKMDIYNPHNLGVKRKNMSMNRKVPLHIRKMMKELKEGLVGIYGDKLKAVYLYGSYARGDYRQGSDVDIMILLSDYRNYWDELRRTSELMGSICLEYDLHVSRVFMTEAKWKQSDTPLLRNIHQDGQPA
jgi:predicted nucleotidyltransferase